MWYNIYVIKGRKTDKTRKVIYTMTNRDFFNAVIAANVDDELTAYAKAEIEKLDARNDKRRNTMTKEQLANEDVKKDIVKGVGLGFHTASELAKGLELSTQKVSALCRQLVESGALVAKDVKVKGKGAVKAYYIAE